jgi:TonB family protein
MVQIALLVWLAFFSNIQLIAEELRLNIPPMRSSITSRPEELPVILDGKMSSFAATLYIDSVTQKVERVLSSWPKSELGERIYGSVIITFVVGGDGSLIDVYPRRISGEGDVRMVAVATKMVKYAAPFLPPPEAVIQGHKSIQFTRPFSFLRGGREP